MFRDPGQHAGADVAIVVKRKDVIRPRDPLQHAMRSPPIGA